MIVSPKPSGQSIGVEVGTNEAKGAVVGGVDGGFGRPVEIGDSRGRERPGTHRASR